MVRGIETKQYTIFPILLDKISSVSGLCWKKLDYALLRTNWKNKELFMELINQCLQGRQIHPGLQELIKMHALACFNYISTHAKKKNEISTRKIFLERMIFGVNSEDELDEEIHNYMRGIDTYSQSSCFGGGSGDVMPRIANAYNLGLFKNLQSTPSSSTFDKLPRAEKKRICSMI